MTESYLALIAAQSQKAKLNNETWLCLQTHSGQEWNLAKALLSLSISAYTPRYSRIKQVFYSRKEIACPLFPTYLFVEPDEYQTRKASVRLLPIKMRARVVGEIEDSLIQQLYLREDEKGFIQLQSAEQKVTLNRPFKHGDYLIYDSGLAQFEAVFDSYLSDTERCIILATMFNQTLQLPVLISELALAV